MQEIVVAMHDELTGIHMRLDGNAIGACGVREHESDRVGDENGKVDLLLPGDMHSREVQELTQQPAEAIRFAHDETREHLFVVPRVGRSAELLDRTPYR